MRRDYYPFGAIYHAEGDDDSDYLFTGKELDEGNGLYYFGARYYDVKVGRFLTQDPVYSDFGPYTYCYNNPLRYVDLMGFSGDDSVNTEDNAPCQEFMDYWSQSWELVWMQNAPGFSRWNGTTQSYMQKYTSQDQGYYKKQYYGSKVSGTWKTGNTIYNLGSYQGWYGHDWVWIPAYEMTDILSNWVDDRLSLAGFFLSMSYIYVIYNSVPGGNWDFKPYIRRNYKDYEKAAFIFKGHQYRRYDDIGNIGWGKIMARYGQPPLYALVGAGATQIASHIAGAGSPIGLPFGDDPRDSLMIL